MTATPGSADEASWAPSRANSCHQPRIVYNASPILGAPRAPGTRLIRSCSTMRVDGTKAAVRRALQQWCICCGTGPLVRVSWYRARLCFTLFCFSYPDGVARVRNVKLLRGRKCAGPDCRPTMVLIRGLVSKTMPFRGGKND